MKNPIVTARERKHIAQRDLAKLLGVSQQFIQRHEVGAAANLPATLGDYYDSIYPVRERLDFLADMLGEMDSMVRDRLPRFYFPGDAGFDNHITRFTTLYRVYVRAERAVLPDLFEILTSCRTRGELWDTLRFVLKVDTPYEMACKVHVHPYTLSTLFEPTHFNFSKPILPRTLPEPFVIAANESGLHVRTT